MIPENQKYQNCLKNGKQRIVPCKTVLHRSRHNVQRSVQAEIYPCQQCKPAGKLCRIVLSVCAVHADVAADQIQHHHLGDSFSAVRVDVKEEKCRHPRKNYQHRDQKLPEMCFT